MRLFTIILLVLAFSACKTEKETKANLADEAIAISEISELSLVVLGTIQDGGSPHIACTKDCCKDLFLHPDKNRKVVSIGIIDPENEKKYILDATPDFTSQMKMLKLFAGSEKETPDGIFLTHAHIGHYTGLMYLGKEAMNADKVPVYAMPRMKTFLEDNGPWSQLVNINNIAIQEIHDKEEINLSSNLSLIPFEVPHRNEYSETVGFKVIGPNKSALFIPDIDKWSRWETDIIQAISEVDYAFVDGTFYDGEELNNRDISQIPHPFIVESFERFKNLSQEEKSKIYFIHFNHTNPLLNPESKQTKQVIENGFNLAKIYDVFTL